MEVKESSLEIDKFILESQVKVKNAREELKKLQAAYDLRVGEIETLHREITRVYRIDMKKISYDPGTGKIHFH
jgi:hypothetical protein